MIFACLGIIGCGDNGDSKGNQSVGIVDMYINEDNYLMVKYVNSDTYVNLGKVVSNMQGIDNGYGLEYCISTDGTGYAVKGIGEYFGSDVVIPSTYRGIPVVEIYEQAFANCNITSVEIPDSVTSIGSNAFLNCSLLTYNIKGGLKYLGNSINEYLYLAGVESTFITTVTIDSNCKFIGSSAFSGCWLLKSIEMPDSVTSIGYTAFYNCSSLTKVNYTGTIDSWAQIEFGGHDANPLYYADNLYINNVLVTEAVLTSATKISNYVFSGCSSLTNVTIGNSVTSIGEDAFRSCSSLTSVVITNNVKIIGREAF